MKDSDEILGAARGLREGWLHGAGGAADFALPSAGQLAAMLPGLRDFQLIGRGGMGAVFRAEQPELSRTVAVKILPLDTSDPTAAERFLREAKVLAAMDHPNIVRVLDAGRDGEFGWLSMEFVEGGTLAAADVTPERAFIFAKQIAAALQHAHDRGLVHRDVKPANVLLTPDGTAKLSDFGLARPVTTGRVSTSLTLTGYVAGTLDYMAPEQRKPGANVDHRADIFSLGAMLYQLLTGRLPMGKCEPPSVVRPGVCDAACDAVIMRAMAYEPDARFGSATEFATALDARAPRKRTALVALAVIAAAAVTALIWKTTRPTPPNTPGIFTNSLGMKFTALPGTDAMFAIHETRIADFTPFADETGFKNHVISAYVVKDGKTTVGYEGRSWRVPGWETTGAHPIVGVNWRDAKLFCEWLTKRERASGVISATQHYRLPTDAEWTLAAGLDSAATQPGAGNFADAALVRKYPGITALAHDDGFAETAPAGSFAANMHRLHDMPGNVWEWTADLTNDGKGVFRGGSWTNADPTAHGTEIRVMWDANLRSQDIGFRCVLAAEK
jgi:hypothetical protein